MLEEVIPSIQLLRMMSRDNVELFQPMQQITNWMREKGVDPDPGNLCRRSPKVHHLIITC